MKELKKIIGKKLPYQESEEYLDKLVDSSVEQALGQAGTRKPRRAAWMLATAASVLLAIGIGMVITGNVAHHDAVVVQGDGPFDEFLNSLTDEEVAMLPCYEIEEIPEY